MMEQKTSGGRRARRFSGKGFYAAMAICLALIGGAAYFGIHAAMESVEKQKSVPLPTPAEQIAPTERPVSDLPAQEKETEVTLPDVPVTPAQTAVETVEPYLLPVDGRVSMGYSGDQVVKSLTLNEWVMHTGVDLEAPVSTPVCATASGTVEKVENDPLWGTAVTILHDDGVISYYANLKSAVNVKVGSKVHGGDVIGAVGETADIERAEVSHLHFAMKKDGVWIDPLGMIGE